MKIRLLDENKMEIDVLEVIDVNQANFYVISGQASYYELIENEN